MTDKQISKMILGFGSRLKKFREDAGLSRREVSYQLELIPSERSLGFYENGRLPQYPDLCKLARVFRVTPDELMGFESAKK